MDTRYALLSLFHSYHPREILLVNMVTTLGYLIGLLDDINIVYALSREHSDTFTTANEAYSETYAQIQFIMQISYIYGKFSETANLGYLLQNYI